MELEGSICSIPLCVDFIVDKSLGVYKYGHHGCKYNVWTKNHRVNNELSGDVNIL